MINQGEASLWNEAPLEFHLSSLEVEQFKSTANIIPEDFLWIGMTGNVGAFCSFCKSVV